ncbi:MAG: hypothetical protein NC102_02690 [Clostridium sp.]|nr:hypothetical protein [Clostridium sp.]
MKLPIKRHIFIPAILLIYLAVMSIMAYPDYRAGVHSSLFYFGVIGVTLAVIILLFFFMRKRDQLRAEREADLRQSAREKKK